MDINRYDLTISSDEVSSRIGELEEDLEYEVVRTRDGNVLYTDADEDACSQYIEDEDLNPERFTIRRQELNADEKAELGKLQDLQAEAKGQFGGDGWELYREDYFSASWAQDQARSGLGVTYLNFGSWPLDEINWDDAATSKRDQDYTFIRFDGEDYYGAGN